MDVLENHYKEHCNYVKRVIEIPQRIQARWQETQAKIIENGMNDVEIRNRKSLEIKTGKELQKLAAVVAINQATTDAEVQKIKNKTGLDYLEKKLNIRDKIDARNRQHELFRILVDAVAQCLVETAKAITEDEQEKRNIEYQLNLCKGIRNGNVSDEYIYDAINELIEKMTEMKDPKSANDVS